MTDPAPVPIWERLLPRLSSGAAVVTALCCIGLSAAVSLATALGATFLTRDSTLEPLLGIMLAITVVASAVTYRRHGNPLPLVLTFLAGALIYGALYAGFGHAEASAHGTDQHAATDSHGATDPHGASDPHAAAPHPTTDSHAAAPHPTTDAHGANDPHATTDPHGAGDPHATTDPHGASDPHASAHPTTDSHADAHPTTDMHASAHPSTDAHAAGAADTGGGHGGGHGGTTSKAIVWFGLIVLIAAQVWDFVRLRLLRRSGLSAA